MKTGYSLKGNVRCPVPIVAVACKQRLRKDKFRGCEYVCGSGGRGSVEKAPSILFKAYIERGLWVGEQGG